MPMIIVEYTILVLIPPEGVGLDLPRPLHKFFILDLHEHLGDRGIERRQNYVRSAKRSASMSFINSPPSVSIGPLTLQLASIVHLSSIWFLSLVIILSSPSTLGLYQLFSYYVFVNLTPEH